MKKEKDTKSNKISEMDTVAIEINDQPSVSMDGGFHVDYSVQGIPLSIGHIVSGPPGTYEITPVPNMPALFESANLIYSNDPLTSSHGREYTIPIKLSTPGTSFSQEFEISDAVNRYFNEVLVVYDNNGTQENFTMYSPDESGETLLENIAPYGNSPITISTPTELAQFKTNYESQDFISQKPRMSNYNYDWENKDQTILDSLNGANGLSLTGINWVTYDYTSAASKITASKNDEEVTIDVPESVAKNWKGIYEKLGRDGFIQYYLNSPVRRMLKSASDWKNFERVLFSGARLEFGILMPK